uniref:Dentin sialophosphoprotein-like n=1 Tax=Rhabditophanes sp. KR3021 TaxID=114890 RepID=A0AC35U8Z5_9BILA
MGDSGDPIVSDTIAIHGLHSEPKSTTQTSSPTSNGCIKDDTSISVDELHKSPSQSKLSKQSRSLIAESHKLLAMCGDVASNMEFISDVRKAKTQPIDSSYVPILNPIDAISYAKLVPTFHRVTMDDVVEDTLGGSTKPAWKQLQDSVSDSYHRAKSAAERTKTDNDFLETQLQRSVSRIDSSPFSELGRRESSYSRQNRYKPRYNASSAYRSASYSRYSPSPDREMVKRREEPSSYHSSALSSGPYAAPAVDSSQGIESRYERLVNDAESRLWKHTRYSDKPFYSSGLPKRSYSSSRSETAVAEDDDISTYMPKPYYSRPDKSDPDYFDFDLAHSVNMFRKHQTKYVPKGAQAWETTLVSDSLKAKGDETISGYLFTKGDSDFRTSGSSYLSAALRTPSFWEHRFSNLGKATVRDTNPVSLESIGLNRPVPSRFTEYKNPDFDDYVDPKEDD